MGISAHGLRQRAHVLRAVRNYLHSRGYLEVPTPSLVPSPAMERHLFALRAERGFLRTSPEFALKRVLASGLHRIYEIGPCWRAREQGQWHGTEFTMLEWYRAGASLTDLMDEVEGVVACAAIAIGVPAPHWERRTIPELFKTVAGVDLRYASREDLSDRDPTWDDAFTRRWVDQIEPTLHGAQFISEWPASQAALAQVRAARWPVAERFEAFLDGVELANAFLELLDAGEQRRRFACENTARIAEGEEPHPVDEGLITAVGRMPTAAGIALGIDRLVAALCGWDTIFEGRVG